MAKNVFECRFLSMVPTLGAVAFLLSACGTRATSAVADASRPANATQDGKGPSTPGNDAAAQAPKTTINQLASPTAQARSRSPAPTAGSSSNGISRTLLDQWDLRDLPGWETRLFLIEYAPGVSAPLHHHPVAGVGYVLSGSFESTFEGGTAIQVHEGQSFRDLPDVPHLMFKNADSAAWGLAMGWALAARPSSARPDPRAEPEGTPVARVTLSQRPPR